MSELLTFLAIAIVTIGVAVFVLSPLVTGSRDDDERKRYESAETQNRDEYRAAAEREIRLDHATGKISDADMARLLADLNEAGGDGVYVSEAGADEEAESADASAQPARKKPADVEHLIASARKPCPQCGKRNRSSAAKCTACGAELAITPEGSRS